MIEQYLDSAIVIDDREDEVARLIEMLTEKEVWVKHHHPNTLRERGKALKTCKIIFLDLELETDKDIVNNIAIIRKLFETIIGKNFGNYGIVVWSKHAEDINELRSRIKNDSGRYTAPLFIVGVDKTKYLKENNYDSLLEDIDQVLFTDTGSKFFLYWDKLVDDGKIETIQNIYSSIPHSESTDGDLKYLLYKLALNQTGIPSKYAGKYNLENDVVKALADMLHYEVVHMHQEALTLFGDIGQLTFSGGDKATKKVFAKINSKLFLDFKNLDQQYVIPGNVYQILEPANVFNIEAAPANSIKILVEMTPPCDFAIDKKADISKILAGFYMKATEISGNKSKEFSKENCYKELDELMIEGLTDSQIFRFDFRYSGSIKEDDLRDGNKYKLLFRFKDKLFADILQKMSSYSSRLGIPMLK